MPLFIHFPAEEDWKSWAHQIGIPLQDPALSAERTIPLPTQGEELVRSFNKAKRIEVKGFVRATQKASPVPVTRTPSIVHIGPGGIKTGENEYAILAILPTSSGGSDVDLLIGNYVAGGTAMITAHPGDHLLVFECTQVRGNLGSWCIGSVRGTEKKTE